MRLAVLNTSIVTADGCYTLHTITTAEAVKLATTNELDSAVGHEATAQIMSTVLGVTIPTNRQLFAQSLHQRALVFKLNGRPDNGVELTRKQLEEIGFSFKLLTRIA